MELKYYAKLKKDENGFYISFPDVPGCFTCAFNREEINSISAEMLSYIFNGRRVEQLPRPSAREEISLEEDRELQEIVFEMAVEGGRLKSTIPIGLI